MSRNQIFNRAAFQKLLDRIEIRRWPWKIELRATHGGEILDIRETVPERDSGEMTALGGMGYGEPPMYDDEGVLVSWVYRQLQRHVLHELAEAFHLDGRRVRDPHANQERDLDLLLEEAPTFGQYAARALDWKSEPSQQETSLTQKQIEEMRLIFENKMDPVERAEVLQRIKDES